MGRVAVVIEALPLRPVFLRLMMVWIEVETIARQGL